jgi:uncharacterized protein YecE (DUF72 family)
LPPGWKLDRGRLEYFLQVLPPGFRHVLEFRDPSWYADDVLALLDRYGVALCLHDMRGSSTGRQRVGPFAYVRFMVQRDTTAAATLTAAYATGQTDRSSNSARAAISMRTSTMMWAAMRHEMP